MQRLPFIIFCLFLILNSSGQSPHGNQLKYDCAQCHHSNGWDVNPKNIKFVHDSTGFILEGRHASIDCKSCHLQLIFENLRGDCFSCHLDPHENTVGSDCKRCHSQNDWIVDDIKDLHTLNGFPLVGQHILADCAACHKSSSSLRFDRIGNDCIQCHRSDYESTQQPNHEKLGFSQDCASCHDPASNRWNSKNFSHDFFPLTGGHDNLNCTACHKEPDFSSTSSQCIACHQDDYQNSLNPNHVIAGLGQDCKLCHTTTPGWKPARFESHDGLYFPIYSGAHNGTWNSCNQCHLNDQNFKEFSCVVCHINPENDEKHRNVQGYIFNDQACLACHPNGDNKNPFDHNNTQFPLSGAHLTVDCIACHSAGYKGTSTDCFSCHQNEFDQSQNPDHQKLNLSTDCIQCHTTNPGWEPARFDQHDNYYELKGTHRIISNECSSCHQGNYNNTPNTCYGCHRSNYEQTMNPSHVSQQFSTQCTDCHSENAWIPATFDHDGMYFPIYSGKHQSVWANCSDCHTDPGNFNTFSCTICHLASETDPKHENVLGYWYQDNACLACHPTGDKLSQFDHNSTAYPLTGAHLQTECKLCHAGGFKGTPTQCLNCHQSDFDQSQNPDHQKLNLSTDCMQCHTTNPGWNPARFDQHDQIYSIQGAHKSLDCAACHQGQYNNTPNTCAGCHIQDYNQTIDPAHKTLNFSTDCASCHTQSAWIPSTFDHDGQYFPIYSGTHQGQWMECRDCHINPNDIHVFACTNCHDQITTDENHKNVNGYWYQDQACLACHPTGNKNDRFDHNNTSFPLTGAHTMVDCKSCHISGFKGTSSICKNCHQEDYNNTSNPNHIALNISDDCVICHTTQPEWKPARFDQHDQYYVLQGAHRQIANDCAKCHQGNYNQTPNTCYECHQTNYNNAKDPDHIVLQFSMDCATCHSENSWRPSTFDHDGMYFPIYSGKHKSEWSDCRDCHINPSNYKEFVCITCHINPETDDKHLGVNGYFYNSMACLACHPTGSKEDMFDHNATMFPLTGAHTMVDCKACHSNGFKGTPTDCQSCHLTDYNSTTNPNHTSLNISTDCAACHTTMPGWKPALFPDHDSYYPLTGRHKEIANDCAACHNGNYTMTPNTCEGCHLNDYIQSKNPDHTILGLSKDCALCHTTMPGWAPAQFPVHDNYYPLTGRHKDIEADCAACHNGNYNNTPNTCDACHLNDYNQSKNPNHPNLGLSFDCALCHTTNPGWNPALFPVHDNYYPLTGAHLIIKNDCAACHNGNYNNTPNTCQGCHLNDYNQSNNPNHVSLNLSKDCALCHTTNPGWEPALFPDHDNYYPLLGAHFVIKNDCAACHKGNYNNTPNTCQGCHLDDYNQTSNPDHQAQQYPLDCEVCHSQNAWIPSSFNHNNYYPLTGGHNLIKDDCIACHMGNYKNTPNTCSGCHQDDYNQANNPNHIILGFTTNCTYCHTTNPGWEPALMPDHDSYYPLIGAHAAIKNNCAVCHNGNYNNTPNTCVGCHLDDYNQTTNPDHQAAQFPTDCQLCHSQNAWIPSTFNHDGMYFPIYSGKHKDEWNTCAECHTNPNNYNIFSCIDCHEHNNKAQVDNDHIGVSGYQYNSNACYSCHPQGKK